MALVRPQNKTVVCHRHLTHSELDVGFVEDVDIIFFYFVVISDRPYHIELASIRSNKNFVFVKPSMDGKVPIFWQFFHIIVDFKRVVVNFVKFE